MNRLTGVISSIYNLAAEQSAVHIKMLTEVGYSHNSSRGQHQPKGWCLCGVLHLQPVSSTPQPLTHLCSLCISDALISHAGPPLNCSCVSEVAGESQVEPGWTSEAPLWLRFPLVALWALTGRYLSKRKDRPSPSALRSAASLRSIFSVFIGCSSHPISSPCKQTLFYTVTSNIWHLSFRGIPGKKCGTIIVRAEELSNCRVGQTHSFSSFKER